MASKFFGEFMGTLILILMGNGVVAKLESGGQSLEESLALWERGEVLADICQRWLDGASARLDEAIAAHDAAPPEER